MMLSGLLLATANTYVPHMPGCFKAHTVLEFKRTCVPDGLSIEGFAAAHAKEVYRVPSPLILSISYFYKSMVLK